MAKKSKMTKAQKTRLWVDGAIGVFTIGALILSIILLKTYPKLVAAIVQMAYRDVFSGTLNFSLFIFAAIIVMVCYAYFALFFTLYQLARADKDFRKGKIKAVICATENVIRKNSNWYFLILTITISIAFVFSGFLFLSNAFPNEPLFLKEGINSTSGSTLTCSGSGYSNIITGYDIPCSIRVDEQFNSMSLENIQLGYSINKTIQFENYTQESRMKREKVTLNFEKEKQISFVKFIYNESEDWFTINDKGVFTKDEYFSREKDKAVWFFAILSFSFFTVFSGMSNLKNIMRKNK
ncbi:hypothetical protein ACFL3V_04450 [Nanoarchaeota archaeon]